MSGGGSNGGGRLHIVMFPWLAFGHISPFAQLARTLVSCGSGNDHGGGLRVTFLTAAGNVARVESLLSSAADAVTILPLQLPRVPGLPAEAASTAELSPAGAELLKVAFDGTRPQVAALLASLRPQAVLFDFASPWVCGLAKLLGVKALHMSVFSAISSAFLAVPARRPHGGPHDDLASAPAGFPAHSTLAAGVQPYQAAGVKKAVDDAVADGGEGEGASKWRDFLLDGHVRARFADKLVRDLNKELPMSAARMVPTTLTRPD